MLGDVPLYYILVYNAIIQPRVRNPIPGGPLSPGPSLHIHEVRHVLSDTITTFSACTEATHAS